jgi:DNA-binding transcriptional regulator GbsR (MarR family)
LKKGSRKPLFKANKNWQNEDQNLYKKKNKQEIKKKSSKEFETKKVNPERSRQRKKIFTGIKSCFTCKKRKKNV